MARQAHNRAVRSPEAYDGAIAWCCTFQFAVPYPSRVHTRPGSPASAVWGVLARVHGEMRRVRVRLELLCGPAFSHEFSRLVQFFIWPRAAPVSHALADARARGAGAPVALSRAASRRRVRCVCAVCDVMWRACAAPRTRGPQRTPPGHLHVFTIGLCYVYSRMLTLGRAARPALRPPQSSRAEPSASRMDAARANNTAVRRLVARLLHIEIPTRL